MTLEEAALAFKVPHDRLRKAAQQGRLKATKLSGGRTHPYLVRPEEVERFIRESRPGPKAKKKEGA